MAWVEGLTNSQRILHTITNILTTANKILVVKYRKNDPVSGKPVDYVLTKNGSTWKDAGGATVNIADYTEVEVPGTEVDASKNWSVVYATGGSTDPNELEINLNSMNLWETVGGFDAKRVVLKTTTTPVTVDASYDEYNTDPDSKIASIEMFLELIKYRYAINPETNLEETQHPVTGNVMKMANNHYIEMRYGDKLDMPDRGNNTDGSPKFNPYIVDKTSRDEQKGLGLNPYSGVICTITKDVATTGFIYTPVADTSALEIVHEYGNKLVEKASGGHPSELAKFSWYVDYKEELYDAMDGGPSSDDIAKGIYLMPQILSGMSEAIPIQFWINCSNDRVSMVLMGDPTIDFDRYLTSFCYAGKIDSFDGEGVVNDTAGNFALTVGSATIPAKKPKPVAEPIKGKVIVGDITSSKKNIIEISRGDDKGKATVTNGDFDSLLQTFGYYVTTPVPTPIPTVQYTGTIDYVDKFRAGYKFIAYTADDETVASNDLDFVYALKGVSKANPGNQGVNVYSGNSWSWVTGKTPTAAQTSDLSGGTYTFSLTIPKPAKKLKIFKIAENKNTNNISMPNPYKYGGFEYLYKIDEIDLTVAPGIGEIGNNYTFQWTDSHMSTAVDKSDKANTMPLVKSSLGDKSVVRDMVLNFVLSVTFPDTWGGDTTATGVTDISMFKTRSGVFNQRHYASFITPEEYMRKDAFNPSRWTGKFHLSPTYVVHGYDGYRGWLKDTVIVDNTSIVHLDELIVNKDSKDHVKPQEIFKYFKLNSPFCFLNNSPNFNYGVGILKSKSYIDDKGNRIELY